MRKLFFNKKNNKNKKSILPKYEQEFSRGSIISINLKNFMSFDDQLIFPGPGPNLLIGTNGSGKSSIIAAIGICLGADPSCISKGAKYSNFIKKDKDSAEIKVRIKESPLVKVLCAFNNNSPKWSIKQGGGEWNNVSRDQLRTYLKSLNIIMESLFMFLPQERVKEFSNLTPSELLQNTLSIISPEHYSILSEIFDKSRELSNLNNNFAYSSTEINEMKSNLESLKAKIEGEKLRNDNIYMLSLCEIRLKDIERVEYRQRKNSIKNELKKLKAELDNISSKISEQSDLKSKIEADILDFKKSNNIAIEGIDESTKRLTRIFDEIEKINYNILNEEGNIKRNKQDREELEKKSEITKTSMESVKSEIESSGDINEIIIKNKELHQKQVEIHREKDEKVFVLKELNEEEKNLSSKIKDLQSEIDTIKSQKENSINLLVKKFKREDVFKFYQFIKSPINNFRGIVCGPIYHEITCEKEAIFKYIEFLLGRHICFAFICDTESDHIILERYKNDKNLLNISIIGSFEGKNKNEKIDIDIKKFGFDFFLIDVISGPDIIIDFLSNFSNFNRIPISLKPIDNQQLSEIKDFFVSNGIYKFFVEDTMYQIFTSNYSNSVSVSTVKVNKSRLFQTTDLVNLSKIKDKLLTCKNKLDIISGEKNDISNSLKDIEKIHIDLYNSISENKEKFKKIESLQSKYNTLQCKLESIVPSLEKNEMYHKCRIQKIKNLLIKEADLIKEAHEILQSQFNYNVKINEIECKEEKLRKCNTQLELLKSESNDIYEKLNKKNRDYLSFKEMNECFNTEKYQPKDDNEKIVWDNLPRNKEEVLKMIEKLKKDLSFGYSMSSNSSIKFQNLSQEISVKQSKHDNLEADIHKLRLIIADLKNKLCSEVSYYIDTISSKFSELMEQSGARGRIELDDENYSLKILVSFSTDTDLALFTSKKQSGGEKSVVTILYLIAVQQCFSFPFRVIDEINQAMDVKNEITTFNQIVKSSTNQQCFIATPKLPIDINIPQNVTVLCVVSGPYVDEKLSEPITLREPGRETSSESDFV